MNFIIKKIFGRLVSKYGFSQAFKRVMAQQSLGEPSTIPIPMEIVNQSADFASRGLLNMFAIQENLDWVMPYWVVEQYDPLSNGYIPSSVLSTNMCYRNWTAIGALGSTREPIVDPRGLMTPLYDGWSVDFWVGKDGKLSVPSRLKNVKQYLVNNLPIVVTNYSDNDTSITLEYFVHRENGVDSICGSYFVENLESHAVDLSLYICIRPYNPEGISLTDSIEYREADRSFIVNGELGLTLPQKPDRVHCSNLKGGDTSRAAFETVAELSANCRSGMANAFAQYNISLKSGEVYRLDCRAPTAPVKPGDVNVIAARDKDLGKARNEVIDGWEKALSNSMQMHLPTQKIINNFNSNKAHLYLFIDGDSITPGPYTYHTMWFRDAAYTVTALDKLNFTDEAKRILLSYPSKQTGNGYFKAQDGEWDANGEALWTMVEHFRYTNDTDYLAKVFPSIEFGVEWIKKNRKDNGLLPAGYSAEHFGPNDTFYWDNFWAIAGLRAASLAANALGKNDHAKTFSTMHDEYRDTVFGIIDKGDPRFPYPLIGSSPSRFEDSAIIGAISALYPLHLVTPRDSRMTGTLRFLRQKFMIDHAFLHRLIHSGFNVYLTAQIAECHLFRRSSRLIPILEWMLDNITHTGTFPEAIHPRTKGGCMGDGHHGWAAADLIHLLRNIVFFEEDDNLIITPVTFRRWFETGEKLSVRKARSYFGLIDIDIEIFPEYVQLSLGGNFWKRPKKIEFTVSFPVRTTDQPEKVEMLNSRTVCFDGSIDSLKVYR